MIQKQAIKALTSGVHNLLPDESIPQDAASDSSNWLSKDGHIELIYGRKLIGSDGGAGKNYGEHTAFRADGTAVRFRKVGTKIQYLNGTTWTDVITGLTEEADYTFSNYASLAGAFVYIFGVDGIYKIATANPGSYASLYSATKNFKGYGFIDKARTILWGRAEDPTGLYGSYIDAQNSTVYTTVTNEAIGVSGSTTYSGTLAFKAGGATRTCFGVVIDATVAAGTETFTDNYNGVLTSNFGGTGTINYMTGAYSVTFSAVTTGAVQGDYQWEDSNAKGVTDFTKSATRLAGEGFVVRQDAGGDAIEVVIPLDGAYFSLKSHFCYRFQLDTTDTAPTNEIFRTDIGVPTLRSATGTGSGILFLNTANPTKPVLSIIQRNIAGDNFDAIQLFPQFAFENYTFDDALVDTWDRYALVACKKDADDSDTLLLCDVKNNTVDVTYYGIRTSTKMDGFLYGGDAISQNTYQLFTGFDDLTLDIPNFWAGKGETFGDDVLKKVRKARYKGLIDPAQYVEVYMKFDNGDETLVGTIRGDQSYVDRSSPQTIGANLLGTEPVGGGDIPVAYPFTVEMRLHTPKFGKRKLVFRAKGLGYVSIYWMEDFDIWVFENRLPRRFRLKQHVSLDGTQTDLPSFNYQPSHILWSEATETWEDTVLEWSEI